MNVPLQDKIPLQERLERAADGDEEAFREVYEVLIDRIFAFVRMRARSREEATDIVQDVFLDLWSALSRFRYISDAHFYSFVFVITKRRLVKHYKTRTHESLDDIEPHAHPRVDADIIDPDGMRKHVAQLSENYRDVIVLRYWSGLSFAEIGDHLGISENNAKVRHHRALKELERLVERYG